VFGSWGSRYRNLRPDSKKDRYWNPSGQEVHLYNPLHHGPQSEVIVLCEGEFDTMIMNSLGYPAVGVPGVGSGASLRREWMLLFKDAHIIIAFDGDDPGRTAAEKLKMYLDSEGVKADILHVPDTFDINDWYLEDPDALNAAMAELLA